MSNTPSQQQLDYIKIVKEGTYFNCPEHRYYSGVAIVCDRCQKSPIQSGYGLDNNDLCMECVHKINAQYNVVDGKKLNHDIIMNTTLMMQRQYRPQPVTIHEPSMYTNMEQAQYKPSQQQQQSPRFEIVTWMMQQQYRSRVGNFDTITPFDATGNTNYGSPFN